MIDGLDSGYCINTETTSATPETKLADEYREK